MANYCHNYVHDRKSGVVMIQPAQAAPMGKTYRVSSESAWPLRGVDGLTWAERKAKEQEKKQ